MAREAPSPAIGVLSPVSRGAVTGFKCPHVSKKGSVIRSSGIIASQKGAYMHKGASAMSVSSKEWHRARLHCHIRFKFTVKGAPLKSVSFGMGALWGGKT